MSEATQTTAVKTRGVPKELVGTVVSNKMDKTIVVEVPRRVRHAEYKKYVASRKRYKAHDERNEANIGDLVVIHECRPLSREKRWRLGEIRRKAAV